jgi:hypothetical protein
MHHHRHAKSLFLVVASARLMVGKRGTDSVLDDAQHEVVGGKCVQSTHGLPKSVPLLLISILFVELL